MAFTDLKTLGAAGVTLTSQSPYAAAASGFSALANRIYGKAVQMASRPRRAQRADHRKRKAPIMHRTSKAAAISSDRMAQAVAQTTSPPVAVIANEVSHVTGQLAKVTEDLGDYGQLPSGDFWKNLRRGAVYINGQYFSFNTLIAALAMMKSMRLVQPPTEAQSQGVAGKLFPDTNPVMVITGTRVASAGSQAVQPEDVTAFYTVDGVFTSAMASGKTEWPVGSFVFTGVVPHLSPDWKAMVKTVGAMVLVAQGNIAMKVASVLTERIGSLTGFLGQGVDFSR